MADHPPIDTALQDVNMTDIDQTAATDPATGEGEAAGSAVAVPAADTATADSATLATKSIEIDLATWQTILDIAAAIGRACAKKLITTPKMPSHPVFVTTAEGARAIANAQLLDTTLRGLLKTLTDLATPMAGAPDTREIFELNATNLVSGAISLVADATAMLTGVKGLLALLTVTESYDARAVAIDPATLASVVAAGCLKHNLAPIVIAQGQTLPPVWRHSDVVPKLSAAIARLRAIKPATAEDATLIADLLSKADTTVTALSQTTAIDPLALMHVLTLHPSAPFLIVQRIAADGSFRTRKHLFTALGLTEALSFSPGSVVSYSLTDRQTGTLIAGDLLYTSSRNLRLPTGTNTTFLSNI